MPMVPSGSTRLADGTLRAVFTDPVGRYIYDDIGQRIYGPWALLPDDGGAQADDGDQTDDDDHRPKE